MKKTFKVVMLPTEKATDITLSPLKTKLRFKDEYKLEADKYQHLYIISDDEIKEGDWFYNPATKEVLYASKDMLSWNMNTTQEHKGWKKIVATTDKSLRIGGGTGRREDGISIPLPQLHESFIQDYIKSYNQGKPITEVDLEIEHIGRETMCGYERIKTRPDNTVIVHQSKMYSKDEVSKLLDGFGAFVWQYEASYSDKLRDKWIQDNLK